jgi:MarR family transcriptional regulator for hemolysin
MTELVDRLVRDGLVRRTVDRADGRAKLLVLTEHGIATAKAASVALETCMQSFMHAFEEDEREQLGILLDKLDRGADWDRMMRAWGTYRSSPRRQRRPPAIHIR